ncbi:hypothetical protein J2S43_000269 [Catenuloplanes nepalensis]|uniref:Uncharacterized protein n=1 Tax=Catenuloplanes nepalensis TaxID=587533 RepID=A0ABT9MK07_9ACTN|nr:hypothetical protein [Catenuloplanes nepalensis]MDP9791757.1 hypothetical protein [Catenuloplanes nepalensis]
MARNPNPAQITDEIWALWERFDRLEPSALLGGIYAAKPGYHNTRNAVATSDYSRADVAADRQGPGDKAAALDLTMSDAAMRKYTSRLDVAARARDERLYIGGVPIIREFIGTKDNRSVYCYVLTGGRPLGVGADAGPDPGRDSTHLWHLHISFIRRFVATGDAMNRIYSILAGESLATWRSHGSEEGDMAAAEDLWRLLFNGGYPPGVSPTHNGGVDRAEIFRRLQAIQRDLTVLLSSNSQMLDSAQIVKSTLSGLSAEQLSEAIRDADISPEVLADAIPTDDAQRVLDALAARIAALTAPASHAEQSIDRP